MHNGTSTRVVDGPKGPRPPDPARDRLRPLGRFLLAVAPVQILASLAAALITRFAGG